MRSSRCFLLLLAGLRLLHADPITLTPGSLLVQEPTQSITSAFTVSYTKTGSLLDTGLITGTDDLAENLTVLNGKLYVSDGGGGVDQVNLSTGAATLAFNTSMVGLNALGSLNGNLLVASFDSTAIDVYSTSGVLLNSINLANLPSSFSWTGLASDGSNFYLTDFYSGGVYEYSMSGVQLGFFNTGLPYGPIGLSYDASNNSLWTTESLVNVPYEVVDLSTTGTELSEFSTGAFDPYGGITVVPSSTPEPRYTLLLLFALLLALGARSRCHAKIALSPPATLCLQNRSHAQTARWIFSRVSIRNNKPLPRT